MMHKMFALYCLLVVIPLAFDDVAAGEQKDETAPPKRDEKLQKELLDLVREDQEARKELIKNPSEDSPAARKVADVDRKNTARLKEIIDKRGWPGRSLVGEDGAHAAWLLVQHADRDRELQKRCLKLLEKAVKAGEASGVDLAYLTDRVLVAENKKQLYGTQFRVKDGKLEPSPIEDEANVDRRRKEVGLPSLAEYRKMIEEIYGKQTKDKK
jgi:hypothetical protein